LPGTSRTTAAVIVLVLGLAVFSYAEDGGAAGGRTGGVVRIMSFNIQIFGAAKMAKPQVAAVLADIVSGADITAIQELRSRSISPVEDFMALLPPRFRYFAGPREGRSSSKEQYLVIYDSEKFAVLGAETYPDPEDRFERNPLGLYFKALDAAGGLDFILINNHLKPLSAAEEIDSLPEVIGWFSAYWNEKDVLTAGDFNADGYYYDENLLPLVFPEPDYRVIISSEFDTTLAERDNTYDRLIITAAMNEDYAHSCGVLRFDEDYDLSRCGIEPWELSDHYPVWADFHIDRDTD
jgi:endonuclease/exonuclease/phosphatase family metal-dependent hydrolase